MTSFSPYSEIPGHRGRTKRSFWGRIWNSPCLAGCLIGAMIVGGVPGSAAATPSAAPFIMPTAIAQPVLAPLVTTAPSLSEFLSTFWTGQFALDYQPGRSGIVLSDGVAVGADDPVAIAIEFGFNVSVTRVWQASVTDSGLPVGEQIGASGFFAESFSTPITDLVLTQEQRTAAGLLSFSRSAVSGVFAGSTNAPVHAYGVLLEMTFVNGSGMAAFVPTGVAADAADAQAGANGFLAHFRPQAALAAGLAGAVYLEADPYGCSAEQRLCYGRAHFNLKACAYGVTAGTVLCIGAAAYLCAASGPGYVFCFAAGSAICLIAEVLALVVCANLYEAALLGCDSARLACEAANAPAIEPE